MDVLLVDADPEHRARARDEILRAFPSAQLTGAGNQEQLTAALEQPRFDVVVVDFTLEWVDAQALLATFTELEIPVVLFAGPADDEACSAAMRQGVVDYIPKLARHYVKLGSAIEVALDRRRLNDESRSSQAELQRMLELEQGIRSRLTAQARVLEEADRRKDELIAILGHEVRNPLSVIDTRVRLLLQQGPIDPAEGLREIQTQVLRIARLLDDLAEVNRLDRGSLTLELQPVDLTALVQSVAENLRPAVEERRHELSVVVPVGPIEVLADALRLSQVLVNLLTNAIKYTPPGGCLSIRVDRRDGEAVIVVEDDGIGIVEDAQAEIFEPFHRDRGGDVAEGLGVGLTIVQRLVTLHQGTIEVESEGAGCGSRFIVRLPLTESIDGAAEHTVSAGTTLSLWVGGRVLVVDDERGSADALGQLLEQRSFLVEVAYDGRSAIDCAEWFRPDAVLLDLSLPDRSGYEVARALRTAEPHVLLIAVTGYGHAKARDRSRDAGCDHHLVKPIDFDTLFTLLAPRARAR